MRPEKERLFAESLFVCERKSSREIAGILGAGRDDWRLQIADCILQERPEKTNPMCRNVFINKALHRRTDRFLAAWMRLWAAIWRVLT
jgi:hypothetical protein